MTCIFIGDPIFKQLFLFDLIYQSYHATIPILMMAGKLKDDCCHEGEYRKDDLQLNDEDS